MQALILAGGEGTRLRPLTSTVPKPVVPLVDRPFIAFMIDWLRGHGVDDVVMSCGHLADGVRNVLGDGESVRRAAALHGGAAAARHRRRAEVRRGPARRALPDAQRRRADRHRRHARSSRRTSATGARGDARAVPGRGPVAPTGSCGSRDGRRGDASSSRSPRRTRSTRNNISAGVYVLERSVLDAARARASRPRSSATSSRALVGDGLYGHVARGYWKDIGTPERYLEAHVRHPRGLRRAPRSPSGWATGYVCVEAGRRERRADRPAGAGRGGLPDRRGRAHRRPRRARARRHRRRGHDDRERRRHARAPRSARTARCAAASSPAACGSATTASSTGMSVLGEGVTLGAGNVVSNGARSSRA